MATTPAGTSAATSPPASPSREDRGRARLLAQLLPRTVRTRLALTQVGLVVFVVVALGVYFAVAGRQLYVDRLADQLEAQAQLAAAAVAPALEIGEGVEVIDPLVKRLGARTDARVTVVAADGTVLGDSLADPLTMDNHGSRPEVIAARGTGIGEAERDSATLGAEFLYVAVPIPEAPGAVARVALPLHTVNDAVQRIRSDVLVAAVSAAALAITVAVVVARRITDPLEDLRRQAGILATGQLDAAVRPDSARELGDVARAFNAMAADLRRLVTAQERSRSRLEATLANLNDGVVITDEAGTVVRLNAAATRMLGTTIEEAVDRSFIVASRDHDLAALLRVALAKDEARTATVEHGRDHRILEASAQPFSGGGERLGLVVLRDVTELRRLERMRREFVANVSHELRTPLASIRAVVETLEAGAANDPAVAGDFLRRIIGEVDHLVGLVDELLDLARLESGRAIVKPEASDPAALLTRAVERLRPQVERASLVLLVEVPSDLPPVRVDRGRIEQVLINLVHNAVKFTPEGGEIVVSAELADGMLQVSVGDTGVGVMAEELPRIFERFYKSDAARRSPGSGLGLAIAKHIVQAHGGTIWAESTPGAGTTVSFTMPLARPRDIASEVQH
ncbi:MAG: sensor kinase, two-component system, OmpR family [Thermomicrobiales bacterium]|nr:sensor kinase, two-component system, OmpR family [Thermomicrobiales bacterium]